MQYEFRMITLARDVITDPPQELRMLKSMGGDGWSLAGVEVRDDKTTFYFQRPRTGMMGQQIEEQPDARVQGAFAKYDS